MTDSTWGKNWLVLDESLVDEWCRTAEARLRTVLGLDFEVGLRLPNQMEAKRAWNNNRTLKSILRLSADGTAAKIALPIPFDGVFIDKGKGVTQALVWENWLAERPGIRRVSMRLAEKEEEEKGKGKGDQLWLAFPDGSNLAVPLSPPVNFETNRGQKLCDRAKSLLRLVPFGPLWTEADYPQKWLRDSLRTASAKLAATAAIKDRATRDATQKNAMQELLAILYDHASDFSKVTDADELKYRVLTTFPRWIIFRLCQYLVGKREQGDDAKSLLKRLRDKRPADIGTELMPVNRLLNTGELVRVAPVNVVEMMARITGVRRFRFKRKDAAHFPQSLRQNHRSFEGRICPLESPESELVGLQLQLARGARVESDGTIRPSNSGRTIDNLDWGAALIPFMHHNDGARNMMGAKNLRQAVPVAGREQPLVSTGTEASLVERLGRLAEVGVCPNCADMAGGLAIGRDLLVAYMPWRGWNVDDAVVISREAAGKLGIVETKPYSRIVEKGISCEVPDEIVKGRTVKFGDVIAFLCDSGGGKTPIVCRDRKTMTIVRPPLPFEANPNKQSKLEFTLSETLPIEPGDKLMGRHGNKGVVARVLSSAEMPHLPNVNSLPASVRGKPVDIIVNPHGILSRMNPGQLLETHIGWLLHSGVKEAELLAEDSPNRSVGDLSTRLDHGKIRRLLEENGLDRSGAIKLVIPASDGTGVVETEKPVVVGYQHFVRLHHVPSLKAQARRGGDRAAYSPATRQPAHGRKAGGGQRIGEMEVWALAAHGADAILGEMLGVKSDAMLARGDFSSETGFVGYLNDWLLALCTKCEITGNEARFSPLVGREELLERMGLPLDGPKGKVIDGDFPIDGARPKSGSLFDEAIFGKGGVDDDTWGYIELPRAVPHPWNSNAKIAIVPVLPLRYRRMWSNFLNHADPATKVNLAYMQLVKASTEKPDVQEGDATEHAETGKKRKKDLDKCLQNLFALLGDRINGKDGLLRHEGLGRRVDRSFRLVIAPDPTLAWNQAGIPADILWELLGDRLKEWADQTGLSDRVFAKDGGHVRHSSLRISNTTGLPAGFSWRHTDIPSGENLAASRNLSSPSSHPLGSGELVDIVQAYLDDNPDTLVVLNRQPSLHKYSFQSFHPVATDLRSGEVLRLPPICCKGFGADFDGDEMVGHIPLSPEAQAEARKLLPEMNLLSVADGKPMLHYDRDLVTGLQLVYDRRDSFCGHMNSIGIPECCQKLIRPAYESGKFGEALVEHLCTNHSGDKAVDLAGMWTKLAWNACTEAGFSFSFYDLMDLEGIVGQSMRQRIEKKKSKYRIELAVMKSLEGVTTSKTCTTGQQAIATMVLSGANGKKQISQVIASRGALEGLPNHRLRIESSLVDGMTWKELFDASWNARRSMCDKKLGTAEGGDLTRRLVFALWPRSPEGLAAAQSIGERGTQLAMQTFHSGARSFDIGHARSLFLRGRASKLYRQSGKAGTMYPSSLKKFLSEAMKCKEYAVLKKEHFQVIWDAINSLPKDTKGRPAKSLDGAIGSSGKNFAWLLLQEQSERLEDLVSSGDPLSMDSPFAKVLFNHFANSCGKADKED